MTQHSNNKAMHGRAWTSKTFHCCFSFCCSVGAAAEHEELLHLAAALGADDLPRDVLADAGEDEAGAVLRRVALDQLLLEGRDEPLLHGLGLPLVELAQREERQLAVGPGHLRRAVPQGGPALVAAVVAEQDHDLLQHRVALDGPPGSRLGAAHALDAGPEEPDGHELGPAVAQLLALDHRLDPVQPLPRRVALADVDQLQLDAEGLRHRSRPSGELSDPLYVVPAIQAYVSPLCNLIQ